jgi:Glycosyl hydrolase family 12
MLRVRTLSLALLCLATVVVVIRLPDNAVLTASQQTVAKHQCRHPNYRSSSYKGKKDYGSNYDVENDVWNPVGIKQTLYSCQHNSFYVSASVTNRGGAVQSYPSSQYTFNSPVEISRFSALKSDFGLKRPPTGKGLDYEFAYDIWIDGYNGNDHTELMIWEYNHRQTPAGSKIGTASLDGARWEVWHGGKVRKPGGDIVTFVNRVPTESGTLDLRAFLRYAATNGWLDRGMSARLWQVDWGAELCATPKKTIFDFTAFNVKFKKSSQADLPLARRAA